MSYPHYFNAWAAYIARLTGNPGYQPPHGITYFDRTHSPEATADSRGNPPPVPGSSVEFLVSAISSQVAASQMTDRNAAQQTIAALSQTITAFIDSDDICPRWPWPGPPPWLSPIASELTLIANTLQEGPLRAGLLRVAGQVLDRARIRASGSSVSAG
jgi:hypothetical protein